ncbi:diguanylate phosphodiesterase [Acidovorax sp. Root275]|uniref:bifunctional diguanylate cyclase/phosphodiesterase n=1 Tax=Acidovorax sp. Root275 TaxID=1736508 RepID=UPI00070AC381|nr:EAL domain-containing protein [Acidovorax sp. Root275]KRD55753.1 diguanylate phosphodiesterase [Acidovorax sp. Root275]
MTQHSHQGTEVAAESAPAVPSPDGWSGATNHRWLPVLLPPLVGLLTLGLTFLYWQSEEGGARAKREQNFQAAADQIAYNLKDRMATYEVVLRGVKGYFEGSERIDRAEFQAYVGALQLRETRPGLQGVSLILQLPASALAAHLDDMRQRGYAQYTVRPEGAREVLAPITHIEPLEGNNLKALGFDVLTLPPAKEALDRARDTGMLALSGQLTLLQDNSPGLVMYMPLYGAGTDARTVEGRRTGLAGWVSAPFRLEDVVRGMSREFDADIGFRISDGTQAGAAETLLFTNVARPAEGTETAIQALQARRVLELGGRRWVLHMSPQPAFAERFQDEGHHPVALMGSVLSLLLAWFTWLLATGRERAVALARDMTAELRATRDDLESTLNAIPDLLFELGLDGRIHHYRSARSEELAVPPDMLLGRLLRDVVPPEAAAGCHAALEAAHRTGYSAGHQYRLELHGATHWFELSIARKESAAPGDAPRFIALSRDITERKRAEARTHQLAYFDALTGLPNRRMLLDRMEHALFSAQQTAQVGAVLYIDLDNFKQINDARGHTLGDTLLMQVAHRLTQQLRPGDTVARLGGDEFVVLAHNVASDMEAAGRQALLVAEEIRTALEAPYTIDTHLYSTTGSIGITLFPKRGEGVEDLLREADTAMYRAKDLGRNRIRFYEAAMQADVQERLALEQDLKKAHALGQLAAFVQNQVDAAGTVVGGELLMRWDHPVRGNVPPSRFIPIAEASGLILRMGDWMIQQACETLARLQAAGRELSLSVNVSERQFRQDDFVERVRHVLAHTGAHPANLILEVTESLLIENLDDTIARMTEIVGLGVRFSIDDFGTGYSSLAYLKRLPLYELKIDKSFVDDTPDDPSDTAIVQSIISVARHLHLRVVAEGVETRAQADFLVESQCECLQGYLFGRPEPLAVWLGRLTPPP